MLKGIRGCGYSDPNPRRQAHLKVNRRLSTSTVARGRQQFGDGIAVSLAGAMQVGRGGRVWFPQRLQGSDRGAAEGPFHGIVDEQAVLAQASRIHHRPVDEYHVGALDRRFVHRRHDGEPVGDAGVRERLFGDPAVQGVAFDGESRDRGNAMAISTVE